MLRQDFTNTEYTVPQINNAVAQILATNKDDYKLEGYNVDSIKLSCRNGYDWNAVTEVMWDKVDDKHLDILIEYRSPTTTAPSNSIQLENAKRHLGKVSEQLMNYMGSENKTTPVENRRSLPAKVVVAVLFLIVAAVITIVAIRASRG